MVMYIYYGFFRYYKFKYTKNEFAKKIGHWMRWGWDTAPKQRVPGISVVKVSLRNRKRFK